MQRPDSDGAAAVLADVDAGDTPYSLAQIGRIRELARNGRPPSPATVYRWASVGAADGVKLEVARLPTGLVSTASAVKRFIARLQGGEAAPGSAAAARAAHRRAGEQLDRAGIR